VDSTLELGVNVNPIFSTNHTQTRALVHGDSNAAGRASNRGTSVGNAPLEETGPDEREEFLESPTQTTLCKPQSCLRENDNYSIEDACLIDAQLHVQRQPFL